jgi:LmbE family N-acetylglucosaminyl deacetylase
VRWLDLPEAPHRGYHSSDGLVAGLQPADTIGSELNALLAVEIKASAPQLVFAPEGFGLHVDHRQVMQAVCAAVLPAARV